MIAIVGDAVAAAGELLRRGPMNFGQGIPGWSAVPYSVHVATDEVVAGIRPEYDRFLAEALADAHDFPQDWIELEPLVAAGCPPLSALPAMLPNVLAEILRKNLRMELLDALLSVRQSVSVKYFADSVDHVGIDASWVVISGRAFALAGPDAPRM